MSNYGAVIFDLYDTLATIDPQEYLNVKTRMATAMNVPAEDFLKAWKTYTKPAARGEVKSVEDRVSNVARDLGVQVTLKRIQEIANLERALQEQKIQKLPGCDAVLEHLSRLGMRIALATNTSSVSKPVLRILGIEKWFDVIVFSFEHQLLKPEPEIYQKAATLVNTPVEQCIFVGDGNDRELNGAKAVGMLAIKVATSRDKRLSSKQSTEYDHEISNLEELIPLISSL